MYITKTNIQNQKSQRCSVAYCNLGTEYAMGTVPIAYSVSRFGKATLQRCDF